MGRPDELPVGDYAVRKAFAVTYGREEMPKPKELEAFGERWRHYRPVAVWYMRRASELPPKDDKGKATKQS